MASIITFDGARSARLGDEWSSDSALQPSTSALGDAAYTFLSWGILSFAVVTGGLRLWHGFGLDQAASAVRSKLKKGKAGGVSGARRRRHR